MICSFWCPQTPSLLPLSCSSPPCTPSVLLNTNSKKGPKEKIFHYKQRHKTKQIVHQLNEMSFQVLHLLILTIHLGHNLGDPLPAVAATHVGIHDNHLNLQNMANFSSELQQISYSLGAKVFVQFLCFQSCKSLI